jgi:hypothetical protein
MADTAVRWLLWPELIHQVEAAASLDDQLASLSLLRALGVSVQEWQDARRELGNKPYRFLSSELAYASSKNAILGHLMAWFSYLVVPRASGTAGPTLPPTLAVSVATLTEQVRRFVVSSEVAEANLAADTVTGRVALDVARAAAALPELATVSLLLDPLHDLAHAPPTETSSIKLKDEPDKAATIYERDDESVRIAQAAEAVDTVLKVVGVLAPKHGEVLDDIAIKNETLVVLLSQGYWANRVSVLAALRHALEKATPVTATRMKERQSFRDLDDWRTLWKKFDELGDIPKPVAPPQPKPTFAVLGSSWTEEQFGQSAGAGPTGELARLLLDAVLPNLDLTPLREKKRAKVVVKVKIPGAGGGGSGSGSGAGKRAPDSYLRMLGAIGEHFVFDQLKAVLPDWDLTNWRSKGKEVFGYGAGDDSLWYDFACFDVGGTLTGRFDSPPCLIEVKSCAAKCTDSFEMSIHEWEVAARRHLDGSAVYVIIRVSGTASRPAIVDVLVDPVQLHLDGFLEYSSRDLLIALGKA